MPSAYRPVLRGLRDMLIQQNGPAPGVGAEPHNQRASSSTADYTPPWKRKRKAEPPDAVAEAEAEPVAEQTPAGRLACALKLAANGFSVFPLKKDKSPALKKWKEAATTDPDQIRRWNWGGLIGVPTGKANNLAVLDVDIDAAKGKDGFASLKAAGLEPPTTQTHHTRRGGRHYLYRHRDGLRNSAGQIAPSVDVRGDGGYIVWWPAEGLPVEYKA